ncbi:low specificity L-threonine aldolase [Acetobacteraceae bacterium]|nr:low specificity L-threonine aldolase [Acetobacteraceae bacterium]
MTACKNFLSDNTAPIDKAVLEALLQANENHTLPYGQDKFSAELETVFAQKLGAKLKVFPVATGTGANALALSALVSPWGAVICDKAGHIENDEGGAPEFYTGGAKIMTIQSKDGKILPKKLKEALLYNQNKGVLAPPIQALSLSQSTECGTFYCKAELKALVDLAHEFGLLVHLDGARLGNAVAALECDVKEITSEIGIDALVFGMGKAGAMAAEPLVIFENERTKPALKALSHLRKRAGQTWSKGRFLSVQALAMLAEDRWLKNSRHANAMIAHLLEGLTAKQKTSSFEFYLPYETKTNELFLITETALLDHLEKEDFAFYRFPVEEIFKDEITHFKNPQMARFVTSFYTKKEDIEALLKAF